MVIDRATESSKDLNQFYTLCGHPPSPSNGSFFSEKEDGKVAKPTNIRGDMHFGEQEPLQRWVQALLLNFPVRVGIFPANYRAQNHDKSQKSLQRASGAWDPATPDLQKAPKQSEKSRKELWYINSLSWLLGKLWYIHSFLGFFGTLAAFCVPNSPLGRLFWDSSELRGFGLCRLAGRSESKSPKQFYEKNFCVPASILKGGGKVSSKEAYTHGLEPLVFLWLWLCDSPRIQEKRGVFERRVSQERTPLSWLWCSECQVYCWDPPVSLGSFRFLRRGAGFLCWNPPFLCFWFPVSLANTLVFFSLQFGIPLQTLVTLRRKTSKCLSLCTV